MDEVCFLWLDMLISSLSKNLMPSKITNNDIFNKYKVESNRRTLSMSGAYIKPKFIFFSPF